MAGNCPNIFRKQPQSDPGEVPKRPRNDGGRTWNRTRYCPVTSPRAPPLHWANLVGKQRLLKDLLCAQKLERSAPPKLPRRQRCSFCFCSSFPIDLSFFLFFLLFCRVLSFSLPRTRIVYSLWSPSKCPHLRDCARVDWVSVELYRLNWVSCLPLAIHHKNLCHA